MNIIVVNNTSNEIIIGDLCGVSVTISGSIDLIDQFSLYKISASDDLLTLIASSDITINNGSRDLTPSEAVKYVSLQKHLNPVSPDGKEIIRADTRPVGTQTYFTSAGDTETGIGDGDYLHWDFSIVENDYDPDSLENGPTVTSGYRAKRFDVWYNEPVYLKDGTMYFENAPFGSHVSMFITVPSGGFYPNASGTYTSAMLGLPGDQMYAYATNDVLYASYVMKHGMVGSCTVGDELNAEGSQIEPIPAKWYITGLVVAPENECSTFRGFGSLEMYRQYTMILPGGAKGGE
jgi:hypothetical protein